MSQIGNIYKNNGKSFTTNYRTAINNYLEAVNYNNSVNKINAELDKVISKYKEALQKFSAQLLDIKTSITKNFFIDKANFKYDNNIYSSINEKIKKLFDFFNCLLLNLCLLIYSHSN